jgi:hypothetical protein
MIARICKDLKKHYYRAQRRLVGDEDYCKEAEKLLTTDPQFWEYIKWHAAGFDMFKSKTSKNLDQVVEEYNQLTNEEERKEMETEIKVLRQL